MIEIKGIEVAVCLLTCKEFYLEVFLTYNETDKCNKNLPVEEGQELVLVVAL